MGEVSTKERHEKRIQQKSRHIQRQVNIAKKNGMSVREAHRFAKHNAMNCKTPKCPMCGNPRHNRFVKQKRTIQELIFIESGKIVEE